MWIMFKEWRADEFAAGKQSTAKWGGTLGRLVLVFRRGDILLGSLGYYGFRLLQPLGFKGERHLSMVAGTGTGKTTLLITMLGLHQGNAFVVDPKGQIAKTIARRRGAGARGIAGLDKDVHILDPYGILKHHRSASWNAMDELMRVEKREGRDGVVKYAMKMAEGIVPIEGDKPYFPKTAREFLQGLILHVYTTEPTNKRNMIRVRDLITRGYADEVKAAGIKIPPNIPDFPFRYLLDEMQANQDFGGVIANAGATMANTGRSYGDVLSTARSAMKFFDMPEIRTISRRSDFSLEDLKTGNLDLFICAPTGAIREELRTWFRLITVVSLDLFEKIPGNLSNPTLFAIDEMPSLGHIEAIAVSAPVMRGYGVRLLAITQDLEKLKKAYPQDWRGFLGNSDVTYWLGTNEYETGKFLSDYLGEGTVKTRTSFWNPFSRRHQAERALMTPDQVMQVLAPHKSNMILTRFGKRPLRVKTMPYFKELPVWFYEADTEHKETRPRRLTRRIVSRVLKGSPQLPAPTPNVAIANQTPLQTTPSSPIKNASVNPTTAATNQTSPTPRLPSPNSFSSKEVAQALALFGLPQNASLQEVKAKMQVLQGKAKPSTIYAKKISQAYAVLLVSQNP